MSRDAYRRLRRHLNSMPVGFPAAPGGADLRILRRFFSPEEAGLALALDWRPRSFRDLASQPDGSASGELRGRLDGMAAKGSILYRESDDSYALLPFIVGMFEFQIERLNARLLRDTGEYALRGYGLEYLSTAVPQTRIIPIGRAVPAGARRIASYDEFDALIREAGERIGLVRCICRSAADRAGRPCRLTERRELCMVFRDYADTARRQGWGRSIDRTEALEIAAQNQAEGLVLQPSNERRPQFMCACCPDCCGLLAMIKAVPRPADFTASNFHVAVEQAACSGCGLCVKRCPMHALRLKAQRVVDPRGGATGAPEGTGRRLVTADFGRCIGCGLCVPVCRRGALTLAAKQQHTAPPADGEELMETIRRGKLSLAGKLKLAALALLGFRRKGIKSSTPSG
jgi:Na+-translocating ferredoxin:NAD+ oxidoreductase subunit B